MTSPHFVAFELHPLRDLGDIVEQCQDHEANLWSIYGVLPTHELVCIGDFSDPEAAELVLWMLTG